jgi:hypothetical protein
MNTDRPAVRPAGFIEMLTCDNIGVREKREMDYCFECGHPPTGVEHVITHGLERPYRLLDWIVCNQATK